MAFRAFQFCVLFAISLWIGFCSDATAGRSSNSNSPGTGGSNLGTAVPGGNISLSLLVQDPRDVTVARGKSATLQCPIAKNSTGAPFTITWLRDDQILLQNDSNRQIMDDGSLYVNNVIGKRITSVEGNYSCLVKNQHGIIRTNSAKLRIAKLAKVFTKQPNDTIVEQSQPCLLSCQIKSTPPAVILWERDRLPLPQSTRYVPLSSGDLLILSVEKSDAGSYRCKALNEISQKHRYSTEALLSVVSSSATVRAPEFLALSTELNYTVHLGTDLSLVCAASGFPKPTIQWTNNVTAIVGNSSILLLRNVSAAHTGIYTCKAFNSVRQIKQIYNVSVIQPPYFVTTPVSQWFPIAMTVRLECKAEGIPPPQIRWLKDGEPLSLEGRIKMISPFRWLLSHTFSFDKGLYQCVAENQYGKIWTAVQLSANSSKFRSVPPPPMNVRCNSFNNSSICLQWDVPPGVENVQAFTVHSFNADLGEEYLTNRTYHLAQNLKPHTNYTFYIRLYETKSISDQSQNITCETVLKGNRNLKIKALSNTTLRAEWTTLSSDIPCGGTVEYKLQWKRYRHASINVRFTKNNFYTITDLNPAQKYELRVVTRSNEDEDEENTWIDFVMPKTYQTDSSVTETPKIVMAPVNLEAEPLSPFQINLTWKDSRSPNSISKGTYYVVCYREVKSSRKCEFAHLVKTTLNFVEIKNLTPYTVYEFKVRAHNADGSHGQYSDPIECKTLEHVPNPIKNLIYRVGNGSVCIRWQRPSVMNGQLLNYLISYSSRNISLEQWPTIILPASQVMDKSCWRTSSDTVSIPLNLEAGKRYKVIVRAQTNGGLSLPSNQIEFKISHMFPPQVDQPLEDVEDPYRNQKLGIIVGVCISLLCIAACISCMVFQRRCLKARALERARQSTPRPTNGQNLPTSIQQPATTSLLSTCPPLTNAERQCATEVHELQYLVAAEPEPEHIPPLVHANLDTKGGVGYPQTNGLKHFSNGHIPNGHVHITENPQFEHFSNSESRYLLTDQSSALDESLPEDTFNCTQLTNLESSLAMSVSTTRTLSPVLGPNG